MPESNKVTLNTMVAAEVEAVLGQPQSDLTVEIKLADGATRHNWTFLTRSDFARVEPLGRAW